MSDGCLVAGLGQFFTGISGLRIRLSGENRPLASRTAAPYMILPDLWSDPMAYAAGDDRPADKAARNAEV